MQNTRPNCPTRPGGQHRSPPHRLSDEEWRESIRRKVVDALEGEEPPQWFIEFERVRAEVAGQPDEIF